MFIPAFCYVTIEVQCVAPLSAMAGSVGPIAATSGECFDASAMLFCWWTMYAIPIVWWASCCCGWPNAAGGISSLLVTAVWFSAFPCWARC